MSSEPDPEFRMPVRIPKTQEATEDDDMADVFKVPVSMSKVKPSKMPPIIPNLRGMKKIERKKKEGEDTGKAMAGSENKNKEVENAVQTSEPVFEREKTSESETSSSKEKAQTHADVEYQPPAWCTATLPPDEVYSLELIKGGTSRGEVSLEGKPFLIMGRNESAVDLFTPHPMISRQHVILQYCDGTVEAGVHPEGWYVYDLGSTQGTYLNKIRMAAKTHYRFLVGSMIRLGQTNRLYVLHGPERSEAEEEVEAQVIVGESAQEKFKREARRAAVKMMAERKRIKEEEAQKKKEKEEAERGIDWGIGDEPTQEGSDDEDGINPFALPDEDETSEPFADDPKKALKGWFEREGHELDYMVEERRPGHFVCKVELPLDNRTGAPTIAEAEVKGKKKEAIVQCALEACRVLDRLGLLRPASRTSASARRRKNWEEDDFYASDEDEFLDRTGELEKKRKIRMSISASNKSMLGPGGALKQTVGDTYETLLSKQVALESEIQKAEDTLKRARDEKEAKKRSLEEGGSGDSLEAYMSQFKEPGVVLTVDSVSKEEVSRAKRKLLELRADETRLMQLIKIAAPSKLVSLPAPLKKQLPLVGKMRGGSTTEERHRRVLPGRRQPVPVVEEVDDDGDKEKEEEFKEEFDEEDDTEEEKTKKELTTKREFRPEIKELATVQQCIERKQPDAKAEPEGYSAPPKAALKLAPVAPKVKGPFIPPEVLKALQENRAPVWDDEDTDGKTDKKKPRLMDEGEYSEWVPPVNLAGDGKTRLNDELGY